MKTTNKKQYTGKFLNGADYFITDKLLFDTSA